MSAESTASDAVSGALPRAALEARLAELDASGALYTVCLFDLDYFKSVNDAFGHRRGDRLLAQVCDRVRRSVRDVDLLFRYGGDEFVLVLTAGTPGGAVATACRAAASIRTERFPGEPALHLTVSMGVAASTEAAGGAELLEIADRRNYEAKRAGRDRVVSADGVAAPSSAWPRTRLVERDEALDVLHRVIEGVARGRTTVLEVLAESGVGRTRFLDEAAAAAQLRGLAVLHVRAGEAVRDLPTTAAVVLLDADASERAEQVVESVRAVAAPYAVVVVTEPGTQLPTLADEGAGDIERYATALRPLSRPGLTVWLRMLLRGEPAARLVDGLLQRTGGRPAAVLADLGELTSTGGLELHPDGTEVLHPPLALPEPLTALVGRERETGEVGALLGVHRLVTLVGPGGIGKTRLSLAAGRNHGARLTHGAAFVALDEARAGDDVSRLIMAALEVAEEAGASAQASLARHLRDREMLLILDNFEQAVEAAPVVSELLASAPGVRVLVTSRERLHVYGERVYRVPSLAVSEDPGAGALDAARSPAVALFYLRAEETGADLHALESSVQVVAELCRRLDGLPLAIELAAARSDELTPAQLLDSLDDRLDLLVDGPRDLPARQRTLRGAVEWSVALLRPEEERVFRRIGVFAGGWTDDAASTVCRTGGENGAGDARGILARLRDVSLIYPATGAADGARRWAAYESIRAYQLERLHAAGEADDTSARHVAWACSLVDAASSRLWTADYRAEVRRLEDEMANFRVALAWALGHDPESACRLTGGLWLFWSGYGHVGEGRDWLERALASAGPDLPKDLVCGVRDGAGVLATLQGDMVGALEHLEAGVALCSSMPDPPPARLSSLHANLARVLDQSGEFGEARTHYEHSLQLRRAAGDARGVAASIGNLGDMLRRMGALAEAEQLNRESLQMNRDLGNVVNVAIALSNLAELEALAGHPSAQATCEQALAQARDIGDPDLEAQCLHSLGMLAGGCGDLARAGSLLAAALGIRADLGELGEVALSLEELALLATLPGHRPVAPAAARRAAVLYGAADALRTRSCVPRPPVLEDRHTVGAQRAGEALDDDAYVAATAAGAALPFERLVREVAPPTTGT